VCRSGGKSVDRRPRQPERTARLEAIVHHLGVALGGRPAASLAWRLTLLVSKDARLRVVRRRALPSIADTVHVLGIDGFAWKRGQRYDTLLCDPEQRRIIDLLPTPIIAATSRNNHARLRIGQLFRRLGHQLDQPIRTRARTDRRRSRMDERGSIEQLVAAENSSASS
jgi:hypothetical protein